MRIRTFAFLLLAFLILLLSGRAAPRSLDQQQIPSPISGSQTAQPPQTPEELLSRADKVLQQMSKITGLPIRGTLNKKIVSRPEVTKLLTANLHRDTTPEEVHQQEATLKAFGLISKDFDYEKFLLSFYTEQAAGFYDPHTKTMYIADWVPTKMQEMVLSHELTHALQDQNFDLDKFMKARRQDDDAELARQAVVEGYATAAMFQKMLGAAASLPDLPSFDAIIAPFMHQKMSEFPVFSNAPFFVRTEAMFPYIQGTSFIQKALQHGGWSALDSLFTSPPTTTREIFQPADYFDDQQPARLDFPAHTPLDSVPSLKKVDENTIGELGFYSLLGQFLSEEKAKQISPRWVADHYAVFENASVGTYALLVRSRWESSDAALQFFRDYHSLLAQKYPELTPDKRSTANLFIGNTSSGKVILLDAGNEVRWAEGVPEGAVDNVINFLNSMR